MPLTPLIRRDAPVAVAFGHVVDVLKRDAALRSLRPLWRVPDDLSYDNEPPDDALTIRIVPAITAVEDVAATGHGRRLRATTLTIGLEVTWPQAVWTDAANLHRLIEDALLGGGLTRTERKDFDAEWRRLGVVDRQFNTPADWSQPGQVVLTVDEEV